MKDCGPYDMRTPTERNEQGRIAALKDAFRREMPRIRKMILARDRWMCRHCHNLRGLEIHHIVALVNGGMNDPGN